MNVSKNLIGTKICVAIFGSFCILVATTLSSYALSTIPQHEIFDMWFRDSALKIMRLGIMKGAENGNFIPEQPVYRSELSVILDRFATYLGHPLKDLNSFDDCNNMDQSSLILRIQDNEGKPITDALLTFFDENGPTISSVFISKDGRYTITPNYTGFPINIDFLVTKVGYTEYEEVVNVTTSGCTIVPLKRTITLFKLPTEVLGTEIPVSIGGKNQSEVDVDEERASIRQRVLKTGVAMACISNEVYRLQPLWNNRILPEDPKNLDKMIHFGSSLQSKAEVIFTQNGFKDQKDFEEQIQKYHLDTEEIEKEVILVAGKNCKLEQKIIDDIQGILSE